ncbi:hypothetical protein FQN57_005072 [Myotisia sp. PD_48]|nr:hypothetical protein FQN57_005072 [Myotisia sp. PD_48]
MDEYSPGQHEDGQNLIDERGYLECVLQGANIQSYEDEIRILLDEAHELNIIVRNSYDGSFQSDATTEPLSTVSPSTPSFLATPATSGFILPSSTAQLLPSNGVASSSRSLMSFSTCPTICTCDDVRPRFSVSEPFHARRSFDAAYILDRKIKSGFKNAISRFPIFRKRYPSKFPDKRTDICYSCSMPQISTIEHKPAFIPTPEPPRNTRISVLHHSVPVDEESMTRTLASSVTKTLREIHEGQKQRHLAFEKQLLKPLNLKHKLLIQEKTLQNAKRETSLADEETSRLEEKDLLAELSLTEELEREKKALRSRVGHMEAYFSTPTPPPSISSSESESSATPRPREFKEEQRARLRQKHHELDTMDALHESKIKVLRDKQSQKYNETMKQMEENYNQLNRRNQTELQELVARLDEQKSMVVAWLEENRDKLLNRWALKEAISRKQLELETQQPHGLLPAMSFDGPISDDLT